MPIKVVLIAACLVITELATSHGGGLNPDGCHNETKTGGYHCHRSTNAQNTEQGKTNSGIYRRSDFNYRSYKPSTSIGFYTSQTCSSMNIDHLVSLKDAYESGAYKWDVRKKQCSVMIGKTMCRLAVESTAPRVRQDQEIF